MSETATTVAHPVLIWPDKDEAGIGYAQDVFEQAKGIARSRRFIDIQALNLPESGDAADWVAGQTDISAEAMPRHPESPWLFPGYLDPMKPAHNITKTHKRALLAAKLPISTRIHDLRHTNASVMASSGVISLMTIQKNLGHSTPDMSLRYAHLADKTLHEASSFVGSAVTDAVTAARAKFKEVEERIAEHEAVA